MRKLIVIPSATSMQDFVGAGAFDALEDEETYYLTAPLDGLDPPLEEMLDPRVNYLGAIPIDKTRKAAYSHIRTLLLVSSRFRSRTWRTKLKELPLRKRWRMKLEAAPGLRHLKIRRRLRETGLHPEVHEKIMRIAPCIVIVVSRGPSGDVVVTDAMRSARELGIPVLALTNNWDNLSSKNAFIVRPDYLAAIGHQSAEHAWKIHRIPPERVRVVGSPYIDRHFRRPAGATQSPFPFRYVLFAGCYRPFDELRSLELLDRAIEEAGLDLKVVYLPHPRRVRRDIADFVDEGRLRHVVIEPHVRGGYLASWKQIDGMWKAKFRIAKTMRLPFEMYPALLENADFVVCPLSTMMLEAAIFRRRVLVIGYHDGVHRTSPGYTIKYLHYEGVERVDTFEVCRRERDLSSIFLRMATESPSPRRPPKEQMDYWIYHDERPFGRRLEEFVDDIVRASRGGSHGLPGENADRGEVSAPESASVGVLQK